MTKAQKDLEKATLKNARAFVKTMMREQGVSRLQLALKMGLSRDALAILLTPNHLTVKLLARISYVLGYEARIEVIKMTPAEVLHGTEPGQPA